MIKIITIVSFLQVKILFLCLTMCLHITAIFINNNDGKSLRFYSFVIHCCMLWHHYSNSIPPVACTVSLCTQNQFYHISYLSLTVLQPLYKGSFETVVRTKSCGTLLRVYSGKFLYSLTIARFPSFCLHHTHILCELPYTCGSAAGIQWTECPIASNLAVELTVHWSAVSHPLLPCGLLASFCNMRTLFWVDSLQCSV